MATQVEAMAQLGGLILLPPGEEGGEGGTDKIFFFGGVDSCRFRKTVVPGDKLVRAPHLLSASPWRCGAGGVCDSIR